MIFPLVSISAAEGKHENASALIATHKARHNISEQHTLPWSQIVPSFILSLSLSLAFSRFLTQALPFLSVLDPASASSPICITLHFHEGQILLLLSNNHVCLNSVLEDIDNSSRKRSNDAAAESISSKSLCPS